MNTAGLAGKTVKVIALGRSFTGEVLSANGVVVTIDKGTSVLTIPTVSIKDLEVLS